MKPNKLFKFKISLFFHSLCVFFNASTLSLKEHTQEDGTPTVSHLHSHDEAATTQKNCFHQRCIYSNQDYEKER
jgi:hypothetical protein